jgi:mono/diheme cytochrome c family protein
MLKVLSRPEDRQGPVVASGFDTTGYDMSTSKFAWQKEARGLESEEQVTNGGGGMPAFKGQLREEQIKNLAGYVVEDIVGGR